MQMASAPNTAKGKRDFLHAELTEHGKFSELLHMKVPFAVDPTITLVSVRPEVRLLSKIWHCTSTTLLPALITCSG